MNIQVATFTVANKIKKIWGFDTKTPKICESLKSVNILDIEDAFL